MVTLDELSYRLARMEDERGVLDTLYRYGHTFDHGPTRSGWTASPTTACGTRSLVRSSAIGRLASLVRDAASRRPSSPHTHARGFGRYRDRLVRCPDGRYRFTERVIEAEAMELRGTSYVLARR